MAGRTEDVPFGVGLFASHVVVVGVVLEFQVDGRELEGKLNFARPVVANVG